MGIFLLLFAALVFLEASQPEPVNWNPSYTRMDKIPLGSYVLFEVLKEKFPEELRIVNRPPFEFLNNDSIQGTYFFLNPEITFGEAEMSKILAWTAKGNTVFISANSIGEDLLDSLKLETKQTNFNRSLKKHPRLNFINPGLKADASYHFSRNRELKYFPKIDTASQIALGINYYKNQRFVKDSLINFIEISVGKGKILLHLFPEAFGNYFMLSENNAEYAEKALAYIDFENPVFWDAYYKIGKPFQTSTLYILLGNKYLKWAYYFVLIGAVLFVFFEGKRKQKSIEVRPPLANKTHDFTRTIAGIYLEEKQHSTIAAKKINLFLEYIRSTFRMNTQVIDAEFLKTLSERSGNNQDTTRELFQYIAELQKKPYPHKEELLKINRLITNFKKKI